MIFTFKRCARYWWLKHLTHSLCMIMLGKKSGNINAFKTTTGNDVTIAPKLPLQSPKTAKPRETYQAKWLSVCVCMCVCVHLYM